MKGLRLTLFNPLSGVVVVDSDAEFNLTVVDGPSDVQYTMEFADGAGATPYNDSSMLRETFSVPGEYIITATANDTNATVQLDVLIIIEKTTKTCIQYPLHDHPINHRSVNFRNYSISYSFYGHAAVKEYKVPICLTYS